MAKILIVDDDPAIQSLIKHLLLTKGHESLAADSGAKALELIGQNMFDVIITDLRMRHMNGMELLRKVRVLVPSIPVILVTAYASIDTTIKAVDLGVFDYLAKPFKVDDLMGAVERALAAGEDKTSAADTYSGNNPTIKEYLALRAERRKRKKVGQGSKP